MAKKLVRLVYRSVSTLHPDNLEELDRLFRTSDHNNKRSNITGCLAHPDGHFVQVIEGSVFEIERLFAKLETDTRHKEITVLDQRPLTARLFSGWAMARPDITPLSEQSFRIINEDGSGVQVVNLLLGLTSDHSALYSIS